MSFSLLPAAARTRTARRVLSVLVFLAISAAARLQTMIDLHPNTPSG